jgi:hypothetical protein
MERKGRQRFAKGAKSSGKSERRKKIKKKQNVGAMHCTRRCCLRAAFSSENVDNFSFQFCCAQSFQDFESEMKLDIGSVHDVNPEPSRQNVSLFGQMGGGSGNSAFE